MVICKECVHYIGCKPNCDHQYCDDVYEVKCGISEIRHTNYVDGRTWTEHLCCYDKNRDGKCQDFNPIKGVEVISEAAIDTRVVCELIPDDTTILGRIKKILGR